MALQNPKKSCFRSEQNGHCLQQVTGVPGIFAHVFVDKVPALLARKSRVPRLVRSYRNNDLQGGRASGAGLH
jgi:hypothetical protein